MPSPFPGAEDTWVDKVDGVSLDHADDVNGAWRAVIATQHAQGITGDAVTAATHQGRLKYQEAGGLKRGTDIASATTIAVADTAQVFRLTGTTNVATITAPTYPRLVYFEVVSGLTFVHGSGNLTLPGATNLAVPAGAVIALEWTGATWYVAGSAGSGDASTILTIPIEAGPPTIGDILQYDGTHWALHAIIEAIPVDPVAGTAGLRTLGTGAQQAVSGTDDRLSNARPPTAHSLSHVTVGQDPLNLFTATTRGLVPPPGGTPVGARYMNDIGTFTDPAILAGGMSDPMTAEDDIMVGDTPSMGVAAPKRLAKGVDGEYLGIDPADHHLKYIAAPGRHIIYDETTPVQNEPVLAFQGAGVTVTDDAIDGATLVTIPGGAGLSNPMTTPADLIVGGSSGTPTRLPKGADNQVLTVDPTTHLLVWATPSGGGGGGGLLDFMATIVPPVLTSLVKVNENVSVPYTQVGNTVVIAAGQIESFANIRLLVAPSTHTHWHFRAAVLPSVGFGAIDVLLLDSTNSYRCYGLRISGLGGLNVYQWSFVSPTSSDRNVGGTNAFIPTTPLWLHASWDGTTMKVGISADGLNPAFIFGADPASVSWPGGHTPNSFGIGIEGLSALNNSHASIISWEELALP